MADAVTHPAHYAPIFEARQIECLDIARYLDFCKGNAFKYVWRAGLKGGPEKAIEDLEKAKFYMARVLDPEMNLPAIAMFRVLGIPDEKSSIERIKYNVLQEILTMDKFSAIDAINTLENAFRKELSK